MSRHSPFKPNQSGPFPKHSDDAGLTKSWHKASLATLLEWIKLTPSEKDQQQFKKDIEARVPKQSQENAAKIANQESNANKPNQTSAPSTPSNKPANISLGLLYLFTNQFENAIKIFEQHSKYLANTPRQKETEVQPTAKDADTEQQKTVALLASLHIAHSKTLTDLEQKRQSLLKAKRYASQLESIKKAQSNIDQTAITFINLAEPNSKHSIPVIKKNHIFLEYKDGEWVYTDYDDRRQQYKGKLKDINQANRKLILLEKWRTENERQNHKIDQERLYQEIKQLILKQRYYLPHAQLIEYQIHQAFHHNYPYAIALLKQELPSAKLEQIKFDDSGENVIFAVTTKHEQNAEQKQTEDPSIQIERLNKKINTLLKTDDIRYLTITTSKAKTLVTMSLQALQTIQTCELNAATQWFGAGELRGLTFRLFDTSDSSIRQAIQTIHTPQPKTKPKKQTGNKSVNDDQQHQAQASTEVTIYYDKHTLGDNFEQTQKLLQRGLRSREAISQDEQDFSYRAASQHSIIAIKNLSLKATSHGETLTHPIAINASVVRAPNFSTSEYDVAAFLTPSEQSKTNKTGHVKTLYNLTDEKAYKNTLRLLLSRSLWSQHQLGSTAVVLPAIGMGIYLDLLTHHAKKRARTLFLEALCAAIEEYETSFSEHEAKTETKAKIQTIVLCLPNTAGRRSYMFDTEAKQIFEKSKASSTHIAITNADMLDTAHKLKTNGHTAGVISPGSDKTLLGSAKKFRALCANTDEQVEPGLDKLATHECFVLASAFPSSEELLQLSKKHYHQFPDNLSATSTEKIAFKLSQIYFPKKLKPAPKEKLMMWFKTVFMEDDDAKITNITALSKISHAQKLHFNLRGIKNKKNYLCVFIATNSPIAPPIASYRIKSSQPDKNAYCYLIPKPQVTAGLVHHSRDRSFTELKHSSHEHWLHIFCQLLITDKTLEKTQKYALYLTALSIVKVQNNVLQNCYDIDNAISCDPQETRRSINYFSLQLLNDVSSVKKDDNKTEQQNINVTRFLCFIYQLKKRQETFTRSSPATDKFVSKFVDENQFKEQSDNSALLPRYQKSLQDSRNIAHRALISLGICSQGRLNNIVEVYDKNLLNCKNKFNPAGSN